MRTLSYSKEEESVQGLQITWGDTSGQDSICRLSSGTLPTQHPPAHVTEAKPTGQLPRSSTVDDVNCRIGHVPGPILHGLHLLLFYVHERVHVCVRVTGINVHTEAKGQFQLSTFLRYHPP